MRAFAWLASAALGACLPFASGEVVERLRVLAVKAEPPSVAPGGEAALSVLVADPSGAGRAVELGWFACDPDPRGYATTCDNSERLRHLERFDDPDAIASLAGVKRLDGARYRAPDAAPGLPPAAPLASLAVVMLLARAGEDYELAKKHIPVLALPPALVNQKNPVLAAVRAGDEPIAAGAPLDARGRPTVRLRAVEEAAAVERIPQIDARGQPLLCENEGQVFHCSNGHVVACKDEDLVDTTCNEAFQTFRCDATGRSVECEEELGFQWFVTAGVLSSGEGGGFGGGALGAASRGQEIVYQLPTGGPDDPLPEGNAVTIWVVLRDGRGGADWAERVLQIR